VQGIGGTQPFRIIVIKGLITGVVVVEVVKECSEISIFPFVIAIQRDKVADNQGSFDETGIIVR